MKVERKDISAVRKSLAIEVDAAAIAEETESVLRGYARKVNLPGFRPGKAPLEVLRKRFGDDVRQDVRDRLMARGYQEAMEESGLRPLGDPEVSDVHYEEGEPLRFTTTFDILPEIEPKDYKELEVQEQPATVEDSQVDEFMEQLRLSRTQWISEEGRSAVTGDMVVCDMNGAPEEGEPFDRENLSLELGATDNLPAFNEKLEGATAGETREFSVDYPDEYPADELKGKSVQFKVVVREVKVRQEPTLDDEFAKDHDFDTLEAMRDDVRERLGKQKANEVKQAVRGALLDKVLLNNVVALPEVLIEQEVRHRLEELVRRMMMQGVDVENAQFDWEKLRKEQEEGARRSVHARLVLDAIASKEALTVSNEEAEQRIRSDAQQMGESPEKLMAQLREGGGLQALQNQLLREKALDWIHDSAKIETAAAEG